jgi:hypothetical protein
MIGRVARTAAVTFAKTFAGTKELGDGCSVTGNP